MPTIAASGLCLVGWSGRCHWHRHGGLLHGRGSPSLALYLIPLQLFVGSSLPYARIFGIAPTQWNQLLILLSLAVLLEWLFFAAHSQHWLPYSNLLLSF